ncbi:hypothetical protein BRARA_H02921 [Brassica rapa]|uniref:Cyclin-dependent protein kinase inhibitor SMR4 n=2 Tax=Brassica TaxID=3705 RepID=A0A397YK77_BRACM|nr:hypothetical protein BRARA_H02921 [Brassica rapa]CAF2261099.1 unnamed protein product [Brassica napus]CDY15615.1 BnaA08g28990D [Brassica napus]VDD08270.1 unnamed protein product [Brassica rapa]
MDNGFSCYGGETEAVDDDCHVGCKTPTREECRIPVCPPCPPPVRRKRSIHFGKKRETPKNGYFQPPELELFFSAVAASRKQEGCV